MRNSLFGLLLLALPGSAQELEVHFIGLETHGESILVRTPHGRRVLIDAGLPQGGPEVVSYLRERSIAELDLIVSTHDDPDHFGGIPEVLEALPAARFWESPVRANGFRSAFRPALEQALAQRRVPREEVWRGAKLALEEGLTLEVLAPIPPWFTTPRKDAPNADSLVIRLTHGRTRLLLMGDATRETERRLLEQGTDLACDVLKVGHHGIDGSTTAELLSAAKPRVAVICCAPGSPSVPSPAVLARLEAAGAAWYRTDRNGTIVLRSTGDPERLSIEPSRGAADELGPSPFPGVGALLRRYAQLPTYRPPAGRYVGQLGQPFYHRRTCPSRLLIPGRQLLTFVSEREATEVGRRRCPVCRP